MPLAIAIAHVPPDLEVAMSQVLVASSPLSLESLVASRPAAVKVLLRHRIDFWSDSQRAIDEVCGKVGISPRSLMAEVATEETFDGPDWDWSRSSLATIVAMIVEGWHRPLEEAIVRVHVRAEDLARTAGDARLSELARILGAVREDMGPHFQREECSIFPGIVDGCRLSARARSELADHSDLQVGRMLTRIRELTDNFQLPPDPAPGMQALWDGLASLTTSLVEHIALETNVLYPRALAGEDPHRARAAATVAC
jgi:regulator of cell morphogenesis and NO signaling